MNRFTRPFKEALLGLYRHIGMTFSSVFAVTITLLLMALFLVISLNVKQITDVVKSDVQIHVQIVNSYDAVDINNLYATISAIEGVNTVTFSNKDQELDKFIKSFGDAGSIFEYYRGPDNPLLNAYIVTIKDGYDISLISDEIGRLAGIDKVNYGGENTIKLINFMNAIKNGGLILTLILSVLAIFLITNTIKITIQSRVDEIMIMRIIGATSNFIRSPFLLEGIIIGIIGALIPIAVTVYGYQALYQVLNGVLITNLFMLRPVFPFVYQLAYLLLIVGITVGLVGSFISVTRFIRWKR